MTSALLTFYLGLIGLVVGCFLGLVSVRWPADEDVACGRSHCRDCLRILTWPDLVPVASYLRAQGRCRTCAAPIPIRYPLIELAAGGLGVWAALAGSTPLESILSALLGWQLLLIAVIDFEHAWLPDRLTVPLLATGLVAAAVLDRLSLVDAGIGAAMGLAGLWLIGFAYRRWPGRDGLGESPLLLAAGGAWVGWSGLPMVFLIAGLTALGLVLARFIRGVPRETDRLTPFGTFLAVGVWLTWSLSL